jgi:hypothetical protein
VDGDRVVGETPLSCDYTRRAPCGDVVAPASVPIVTSNIGDGTWKARVGVVDAGGNFTAAGTQTITVDNGAPLPPPPTSAQFVTTGAATTAISWNEPGGQVSPLTTAHITLCKASACRTTTQPAGSGSGRATLHLADGPGTYTASVALSDQAGNHDPTRATHWAITRVADASTPETPRPTAPRTGSPQRPALQSATLTAAGPAIARDHRTITVRGTVSPAAKGTVTVTLRAKVAGRTRTVTRTTRIQNRRYRTTLRLPSTRWRTATLTVRYAGSATHRAASAKRTIRR